MDDPLASSTSILGHHSKQEGTRSSWNVSRLDFCHKWGLTPHGGQDTQDRVSDTFTQDRVSQMCQSWISATSGG